MAYRSLQDCLNDLEKTGQLVRITEEVDPHLQMAAIHLRVHEAGGPALLFENVKGSKFKAALSPAYEPRPPSRIADASQSGEPGVGAVDGFAARIHPKAEGYHRADSSQPASRRTGRPF